MAVREYLACPAPRYPSPIRQSNKYLKADLTHFGLRLSFQGLSGKSGAPGDAGLQGLPVSDTKPLGRSWCSVELMSDVLSCHHTGFTRSLRTKRCQWPKGTHTHTHRSSKVPTPATHRHCWFISKINFLPPGRHWGSRCCRTDGLSRETSEFGTSWN